MSRYRIILTITPQGHKVTVQQKRLWWWGGDMTFEGGESEVLAKFDEWRVLFYAEPIGELQAH